MSKTEHTYFSLPDLPSRCLPYTGIKKDEIKIRALIAEDEKLTSELNESNADRKLAALLKRVLVGIDPLKLTNGDRLYILVWLVINSYDPMFRIKFNCHRCARPLEMDVDLSKLKEIMLPKEYKEPYIMQLSDDVVKLRLLTVQDEIAISDYEKMSKESGWIYRYAHGVVSEGDIWDKVKYLSQLKAKDFARIRAFHEAQFNHGLKMQDNYMCASCGGDGVVPVPFRLEMLFPYGERLKNFIGDAVQPVVLPASATS